MIAVVVLVIGALGAGPASSAFARGGAGEGLAPLSTLPVPASPDIANFVQDNAAAVKLGKALFWDMQAGSDGRTACATCHFNAGADNRSRNQLNPRGGGFDFNGKGPNAQMTAADFPFHKLTDPNNANSAVISTTNNVSGSQGVLPSTFDGVDSGNPLDLQTFTALDDFFAVGGVNVRRSTGRNTPSVINAVFNHRNFWDGRAQNDFNGVNPFGSRDSGARVGKVGADGRIDQVRVHLINSSLASQADGPPGNPVEMSADGRTLSDIGQKLMTLRPLGRQQIAPDDSVLGSDVRADGRGLSTTYSNLIRQAFRSEWWDSPAAIDAHGRTYSLPEYNFGLFWGLAIQAYESTLVSGQAPIDNFLAGDPTALSAQAQMGMGIFNGQGKCADCHGGPAFTTATVANVAAKGAIKIEDAGPIDTGFFNIGASPTANDPGNGGTDPFGAPLSIVRLAGQGPGGVEGTFKVPDLRNVELTAPYFHNGSQMTLRQVVDFYSRGGDFANPEKTISPLGLSDADKDAVVAFLQSLTDPRVKSQSAPFDHPQLLVPAGEQTAADGSIVTEPSGRARDCLLEVPATGSGGGAALARFPDFTGPPCAAEPPAPVALSPEEIPARPVAPVVNVPGRPPVQDVGVDLPVGGGASAGAAGAAPVEVKGVAVKGVEVRGLRIARSLRLAQLRRSGLRMVLTVPEDTRVLRIRVLRRAGGRAVASELIKVRRGGRVTVVWRPSARTLRALRAGSYVVSVQAGPSARRLGRDRAEGTLSLRR